jgi:beta-lactamase regulating signal transducer with metallopeptidase domain
VSHFQSLLFNQGIQSILDAGAMLLLVFFLLTIFRVKNPATRFFFLFVPLLKPFIVMLDPFTMSTTHLNHGFYQRSIRFPDPLNLIVLPVKETKALAYDTSLFALLTGIALLIVLLFLVVRWMQLFLFFDKFKQSPELSKTKYPRVYEMLGELANTIGVAQPKLVVVDMCEFAPFSVGHKRPTIVLSQEMLNTFPDEQLKIMLAHELGHVKRNDNLTGWIGLILRDCLYFNPIAHFVYKLLEREKEKACDAIALAATGSTPQAVANTLIDVGLFYQKAGMATTSLNPALTRGFLYKKSLLEQRVKYITGRVVAKQSKLLAKILKGFAFFLLVYLQLTIGFFAFNWFVVIR